MANVVSLDLDDLLGDMHKAASQNKALPPHERKQETVSRITVQNLRLKDTCAAHDYAICEQCKYHWNPFKPSDTSSSASTATSQDWNMFLDEDGDDSRPAMLRELDLPPKQKIALTRHGIWICMDRVSSPLLCNPQLPMGETMDITYPISRSYRWFPRFIPQLDEQVKGVHLWKQFEKIREIPFVPPEPLPPSQVQTTYCPDCQLTWLVGEKSKHFNYHPAHNNIKHFDAADRFLDERSIIVHIDGAQSGNGQQPGGAAGVGLYFGQGSKHNWQYKAQPSDGRVMTKQTAEVIAAIYAIEAVRTNIVPEHLARMNKHREEEKIQKLNSTRRVTPHIETSPLPAGSLQHNDQKSVTDDSDESADSDTMSCVDTPPATPTQSIMSSKAKAGRGGSAKKNKKKKGKKGGSKKSQKHKRRASNNSSKPAATHHQLNDPSIDVDVDKTRTISDGLVVPEATDKGKSAVAADDDDYSHKTQNNKAADTTAYKAESPFTLTNEEAAALRHRSSPHNMDASCLAPEDATQGGGFQPLSGSHSDDLRVVLATDSAYLYDTFCRKVAPGSGSWAWDEDRQVYCPDTGVGGDVSGQSQAQAQTPPPPVKNHDLIDDLLRRLELLYEGAVGVEVVWWKVPREENREAKKMARGALKL